MRLGSLCPCSFFLRSYMDGNVAGWKMKIYASETSSFLFSIFECKYLRQFLSRSRAFYMRHSSGPSVPSCSSFSHAHSLSSSFIRKRRRKLGEGRESGLGEKPREMTIFFDSRRWPKLVQLLPLLLLLIIPPILFFLLYDCYTFSHRVSLSAWHEFNSTTANRRTEHGETASLCAGSISPSCSGGWYWCWDWKEMKVGFLYRSRILQKSILNLTFRFFPSHPQLASLEFRDLWQ